jgi:5-methylthioribose kinase
MKAPTPTGYVRFTAETLLARLAGVAAVTDRLGGGTGAWQVREVGDGNLNLVFIVESPQGAPVVKQALPYVRLVGDSWLLPLKRCFFEYNALIRQAARDPGRLPDVYHFDQNQALVVMRYLSPHDFLRKNVVAGRQHANLARGMGHFLARTLFRGSNLSLPAPEAKAGIALHQLVARIWADTMGFCGVEMHRRILGLAHIGDLESIPDEGRRVVAELRALALGRHLAVNREAIPGKEDLS